jgi:hypothetical protein
VASKGERGLFIYVIVAAASAPFILIVIWQYNLDHVMELLMF